MATPLSQHGVESEIVRLANLAERVTHEMRQRAEDWAAKDVAYDLAFARSLIASDGKSGAIRKAEALLSVENEYRAARMAEAVLDSAKEAGRNYRAQLEALRSLNANLRPLVSA